MLSKQDKKRLGFIEDCFKEKNMHIFSNQQVQEMQDILDFLCEREVLRLTEADQVNIYLKVGDFSVFNEWINEQEKEEKRLNRSLKKHEYTVAIISAIIGALFGGLVTYILFVLFGIGG